MQHRQEDRTLNGKLELALLQQFTEQFGQARLAPKSLEDQHRPDLLRRRHQRRTVADRPEHCQLLAEALHGQHQPIQFPAGLKLLKSPQAMQHALPDLAFDPLVFDQQQILPTAGLLHA